MVMIKKPNRRLVARRINTKKSGAHLLQFTDGKVLDLSSAKVMGVLNITPDSFSDGGKFNTKDQALKQAIKMVEDGAAIIDIGGESTRPNAKKVSVVEELDRVIPIIESIKQELDTIVSIDTSKAEVMSEAILAGADMINDVCALSADGALAIAVKTKVPVCIMHMSGDPTTMQQNPKYDDVVTEVLKFLSDQANKLIKAGVDKSKIIIDPGFGFGKTLAHNLTLLKNLKQFSESDFPVLVGISRKSMLGSILNTDNPADRLYGSISGAVIATMHGAKIIRAHDVKATTDAVKIANAVLAQ